MFASLIVIASALASVQANGVPLFGWSSDASTFKDSTHVRAGVTLKSADAVSQYMPSTSSSPVVVFVQEGLSLSMISAKSAEMNYVKSSMESAASSIFLPSVSSVSTMFENKKNVVVIELETGASEESISAALKSMEVTPSAVFLTGAPLSSTTILSRRSRSLTNTPEFQSSSTCSGNACRTYRSSSTSTQIVSFASPAVLLALPSMILIVVILIAGIFGLMVLENNQKFPSVDDEYLIISTRNE